MGCKTYDEDEVISLLDSRFPFLKVPGICSSLLGGLPVIFFRGMHKTTPARESNPLVEAPFGRFSSHFLYNL